MDLWKQWAPSASIPGARRVVRFSECCKQGLTAVCFLSSFRPWCRTPWLPCACAHRALCLCLLPSLEDRWAGPGPARPSLGWAGAAPACGSAALAAASVLSCFLNGLVCCIHRLRLLPPAALSHTGGWWGGHCGPGGQIMEWEPEMELEGHSVAAANSGVSPDGV